MATKAKSTTAQKKPAKKKPKVSKKTRLFNLKAPGLSEAQVRRALSQPAPMIRVFDKNDGEVISKAEFLKRLAETSDDKCKFVTRNAPFKVQQSRSVA